MRRGRVTAAVALIAVLAGALVFVLLRDRGADGAPSATVTTSLATSDTATLSATPSEAEPVAVPTPDTTGDDFNRIIREINDFRDWLYAHPSHSAAVDLIYDRRCDCYDGLQEDLEELESRGWRFDDEGTSVSDVEVLEDDDELVRVEVVATRRPQRIVDLSGDLIDSSSGGPPTRYSFLIRLLGDGRWKVITINNLGEA